MSRPWAILCCGCNRVMDQAGKAIGTPHPGALNIGALLEISGQAACFATKPEADDAARAAGWGPPSMETTAAPSAPRLPSAHPTPG